RSLGGGCILRGSLLGGHGILVGGNEPMMRGADGSPPRPGEYRDPPRRPTTTLTAPCPPRAHRVPSEGSRRTSSAPRVGPPEALWAPPRSPPAAPRTAVPSSTAPWRIRASLLAGALSVPVGSADSALTQARSLVHPSA